VPEQGGTGSRVEYALTGSLPGRPGLVAVAGKHRAEHRGLSAVAVI